MLCGAAAYQIWKMVRGLPFDNTKRPADHQSLKPAAWSKHPAVNMWMGSARDTPTKPHQQVLAASALSALYQLPLTDQPTVR